MTLLLDILDNRIYISIIYKYYVIINTVKIGVMWSHNKHLLYNII
jgi:hypothetical protein